MPREQEVVVQQLQLLALEHHHWGVEVEVEAILERR